jgi:two-component system phosphate regulon response regulator PhoB
MKRPLVYVVDDDDSIREAFADVLTGSGYDVHSYRNGREAVEALERDERPELILLDWMMPVMSGSEFVRERKAGDIPVVVISAVADAIGEIPGVRERVNKPLGLHELMDTVERHCEPELRRAT